MLRGYRPRMSHGLLDGLCVGAVNVHSHIQYTEFGIYGGSVLKSLG